MTTSMRFHGRILRLFIGGLLVAASVGARADGALATSKAGHPHAAIVVDEPFGRAEADALKQCGKDCEVAQRFSAGCASYASGQYANGWSSAATKDEADFSALQRCRQFGSDCVTRVSRCESREETPGAASAQQAQMRMLSSRTPDAMVDLPQGTLHTISLSRTFTIPKGTHLAPINPAVAARSAPVPADALRMVVLDCAPLDKHPKFQLMDPPCRGSGVVVPKALIAPSGKTLDTRDGPVVISVATAPFPMKYTEFSGFVAAGVRLYKAPDQPNPADLGYAYSKDTNVTWFYVDPAACQSGGKVFDCSQPSPFSDNSWKPIGAGDQSQASAAGGAAVGDDTWAVAGVRTGMSVADARAALEHEGLRVTSTLSYYQFRHPITGMLTPDRSVGMVALLTGVSQGSVANAPVETVNVVFTPVPGGERVYAVWERMEYERVMNQAVPLDNLRKAAADKFGAPLIDTLYTGGNYTLYWAADHSLNRLKPWIQEPALSGVATECGSRAVSGIGSTLSYMGYSPLAPGAGASVEGMRSHCNDRFVAGRVLLSATGSSSVELSNSVTSSRIQMSLNPKAAVLEYHFWLYDASIAKTGQDALQSAEAALTARALKQQQDAGAGVKPKL